MENYNDFSDSINIKFHGIEMRGINDGPGALMMRSCPNLEEHEIHTKIGMPVRVGIQKGSKPTALITFHDIGTNYWSFVSFFNYPEMKVILDHFTVYHINAPGHHHSGRRAGSRGTNGYGSGKSQNNQNGTEQDGDKDWEDEENQQRLLNDGVDGKKSITSSSREHLHRLSSHSVSTYDGHETRPMTQYPSMAELADVVASVVDHFQLKYFLGFGMGAGANVLVRYGLANPTRLHGLFLINPDDTTTGYYPWTRATWSDIPYLKTGVVTDWIQSWLLDHWFGACTERNVDLEQSYLQLLDELNSVAVAGYIESYMNRTALGMSRPIPFSSGSDLPAVNGTQLVPESDQQSSTVAVAPGPICLKVDTFLVAGEMAPDLCRLMVDMNANMDPTKTQFISVPDCTGAVMDEMPAKLAILLLNFLRNLGMLVTLTPEKLQKTALERQIEQAKALHGATDTVQIAFETVDEKC